LQQCLLQEVHVLVLVDGECFVFGDELIPRRRIVTEHLDRQLEQVLEVDHVAFALPMFVALVDLDHEIARDGWVVGAEAVEIDVGADAAVLGPLDLGGEVARGTEPVGLRQRVADLTQRLSLAGHDLGSLVLRQVAELGERRGVEGARSHAFDAEGFESRPHLARGTVGEGDCQDLGRGELAGGDLVGYAPGDGGRLAGAGSRKDADGPSDGFDG
jgi:hypothetical protein